MNYLKLALKIGPWIAIALLSVGLWSSINAGKAKDIEIEAQAAGISLLTEATTYYAAAVDQRDEAIKRQSASIDALRAAADADRTAYNQRLAAARQEASVEAGKATSLLALTAPEGELAQCRAARDLLEKELVE
ncbi:hypothetical protein QUC32_23055 [Novosphingobium resinovorum]|uniref:hypothetical protein n=1 Tax=Novosphingobium TaxID=165696 RepID=UPI001B3C7288|nr:MULTISPECIES: hypothetical protein [Novosphingobium]MBF7012530.1 hypothetical protein [Novosphingobium sp. HR1a]WJM27264.1 hypothetical protein QUC32_23055 [Novosphingobium resinovorum]